MLEQMTDQLTISENSEGGSFQENDSGGAGGCEFSETLGPLQPVCDQVGEYLRLDDPHIIPVLFGSVAAFLRGFALVWLLIVGPSSSAKTELIRLLRSVRSGDQLVTYELSALTEKTLASGLKAEEAAHGTEPSLLAKLDNKILLLKDLTTVLSARSEIRKHIFAQLREIYDGSYDAVWGTGKELHWSGRVGLIAGVTTTIDREHESMGELGPRFVLSRMASHNKPWRVAVAKRAMRNAAGDEDERRNALSRLVADFFAKLPETTPQVSDDAEQVIAELAEFATRARSPVYRHSQTRELVDVPDVEVPGRFVKQLLALAQGVALVCGHDGISPSDLNAVRRVALDTLPPIRRKLVDLLHSGSPLALKEICAGVSGSSRSSVNRALEDLQVLEVIERANELYLLRPEYADLFSETQAG